MLSHQQVTALELMLTTPLTQKEIAEKVGVAEITINRWLNQNTEFQRELSRQMNRVLQGSVLRHLGSITDVLATLKKEATEAQSSRDRIAASDKFLAKLLDLMERFDTKETIARLERQLTCDESLPPPSADDGEEGKASDGDAPSCL